jgi:TonB family protein
VPPSYPGDARQEKVTGVVILEAIVDEQGNVAGIRPLKSPDQRLTDAASAAVKQWKYEPATLQGKPVAVYLTVTIKFSLQ